MSARKHPKVAAFALYQGISYSFQPSNPMVLFALFPVKFKALKVLTHTTLWNTFDFNEPRICFCLSTFYFLLKAKDKLLFVGILVFIHPIVLVKHKFLSDDLETERLKPVGCEHCGPNSDIKWRLRRSKHILAVSGSVSESGSLFRRLLILCGESELYVFHSGRKTTEN